LRLSEHCSKMTMHLNALTKLEKEKANVWPKISNGRDLYNTKRKF
jgi:hypothetical protein